MKALRLVITFMVLSVTQGYCGQIPSIFLNAVVALGRVYSVDREPPSWHTEGSGFLYGVPVDKNPDASKRRYRVFLVTAGHVVAGKPNIFVRINPQDSSRAGEQFEIKSSDQAGNPSWVVMPSGAVDVAVFGIDFDKIRSMDVAFFQSDDHALNTNGMIQEEYSAGDEVFLLGFPQLADSVEKERNYVIVRRGVISKMPEANGPASSEYLLDVFAFPGNSGGPVVTALSLMALQGSKVHTRVYLVGLVREQFNYVEQLLSQQTKEVRSLLVQNAGIAGVLPVDAVNATVQYAMSLTPASDAQSHH